LPTVDIIMTLYALWNGKQTKTTKEKDDDKESD